MARFIVLVVLLLVGVGFAAQFDGGPPAEARRDLYLRQLGDDDRVAPQIRADYTARNTGMALAGGLWVALAGGLYSREIRSAIARVRTSRRHVGSAAAALVLLTATGCWRPVEPVKLEVIAPNEEGFLIPLTGDTKKQVSTASEEFLKQSLVLTKQVRIPQQWVQTGRLDWTGSWKDSAVLIKVDRTPVTREWTADPNSGTSNKNEAVWVQSSDQVEWSTGWTCTARITGREDAVKFLANYPNGALPKVMDEEVRSKIQAVFGLAVTDTPMETLRKGSTPVMQKTIEEVKTFFKDRGVVITNLGITGGYVYKDTKIRDMMVEVFNAEQGAAIARAGTEAQREKNKAIEMAGEAESRRLLTVKRAEAEGINLVAEARQQEVEMVKSNSETYLLLKRMELEKDKLTRWDGKFPTYWMGGSGGDKGPDMLLQVPAFATTATARP